MVSIVFEALMWDQFYYNIALLVSFTVIIFDHILTLSDEINYIWRKKLTPFSVVFLLNRYFVLSMMVRIFLVVVTPTNPRAKFDCVSWYALVITTITTGGLTHGRLVNSEPQIFFFLLSTVTTLLTEAILILRVYAVYNYNKPVLGLLASVWTLHFALMIVSITGAGSLSGPIVIQTVISDAVGTSVTIPKSSQIGGILYIFPAILFDTIVGVFLTLGLYQGSGPYQNKMPLVGLIIRDGLLYFTVVFLTNICWILVHSLTANTEHVSSNYFAFLPLETWSACITTTMIGRLTLNLRMYDPAANNELTFQTMTLHFHHSHQDSSQSTRTNGVTEGCNINEAAL